jgi:hypothetical protein
MDSISAGGIEGKGLIGTLVAGLIISSAAGLDITFVLSICLLLYVGAKVLPNLLDPF